VKYERNEGTLNEYAGERMHPADIKKRPIHPTDVGGIPRKTSPAPTNRTGRALTSGYTVVKSALLYERARKWKYSPQKKPEPITHNQAFGVMDCAAISLQIVGTRPIRAIKASILPKKTSSDLYLRASRFQPACMNVERNTKTMAR
jgi:hypothetical protein